MTTTDELNAVLFAHGIVPEFHVMRDALLRMFEDIPKMHERKCHYCGEIHWHASDVKPYVCCPECKSQDTRKVIRR